MAAITGLRPDTGPGFSPTSLEGRFYTAKILSGLGLRPPRMPTPFASRAPSAFGTGTFSSLKDLLPGHRKMRGIGLNPLSASDVFLTVAIIERHFPDRGRAFHFDWNALKGQARILGKAQPMRRSRNPPSLMVETGHLPS